MSDTNFKEWDIEGCIRLMCAIAAFRSYAYRKAYKNYLNDPTPSNWSVVRYKEKRLRGPVTNLDDRAIKALQQQVERGERFYSEWSSLG